jgi:hypothetical protein
MHINETFTSVEKKFNIAGSIPLVGVISGSLRSLAGQIQAIAGLVFAAAAVVAQVFDIANSKKWEERSVQGLEYALHGGFNFLRGTLETFGAAMVIPSLISLGVQFTSKNGFEPIFKYGQGFPPSVAVDLKPALPLQG